MKSVLSIAMGVAMMFAVSGSVSGGLILTNTHNYDFMAGDGAVTIKVDVYDDFFGDTSKYRWEYSVTNNGFDPDPGDMTGVPGPTNGFSGFELALPAAVPDLADIYAPNMMWETNAYSGQPVEWDIKNSLGTGVLPGETGVFGFSSLPRLITNSTGYFHTWESDVQTYIVDYSNTPRGIGPEVPDVLSPPNNNVPEPTALAVWSLLGGIGLVVGRRRGKRNAA